MTITILAILTAIVVPTLNDDARLRLMAASAILASDIELAQVLTIAKPDEPVLVRFDPNQNAYWLADEDAPDTPNTPPGLVVFGEGRALTAVGVQYTLTNVTNNTIEFNAQGGLTDFSASPVISLRAGARTINLEISATTGTISETAGS